MMPKPGDKFFPYVNCFSWESLNGKQLTITTIKDAETNDVLVMGTDDDGVHYVLHIKKGKRI